jgi:hypothetical protein
MKYASFTRQGDVEGDVVAVRERPARPAHLCPDREALRSAEVGAEIDRPALLG